MLVMSLMLAAPLSGAHAGDYVPDHVTGSSASLSAFATLPDRGLLEQKTTLSGKIEAIRRMSGLTGLRASLRHVPGHSGHLADNAENTAETTTKSVALCGQAAFNQVMFSGWSGRAPPLSTI
tara:strand:+ start:3510 stop:3875 length:366 start_codon:yes stop_codon:yes gene_type:complete